MLTVLETDAPWYQFALDDIRPMLGVLLAATLSLIIGLEREYYAKAAGMRTYMLVGMGAALFTVIGKLGFEDVGGTDGGRIAAQVVSGIGFLGAGLIFVRRDAVRGLTTAAGIWFVAAIGMAAGAGLYLISLCSSLLYLLAMFGLRPLSVRMPHARATSQTYTIRYADGRGALRDIVETFAKGGVKVADLRILGKEGTGDAKIHVVSITGEASISSLNMIDDDLRELPAVISVIQSVTGTASIHHNED
ncbi:MAG: MgtC/SapB family protein [Propionibacteriaceae bacterium]|jgi:putative Mg2+ transporter-C (MgtC) family protein|nr:MgtC/SapB family protein [Propionibacteriaceae bacterium]